VSHQLDDLKALLQGIVKTTSSTRPTIPLSSPKIQAILFDTNQLLQVDATPSATSAARAAISVLRAAPLAPKVIHKRIGQNQELQTLFTSTKATVVAEGASFEAARRSLASASPASSLSVPARQSNSPNIVLLRATSRRAPVLLASSRGGGLIGELSSDLSAVQSAVSSSVNVLTSEERAAGQSVVNAAATGLGDAANGVVTAGNQALSAITGAASSAATWFVDNSGAIADAANLVATACGAVALGAALTVVGAPVAAIAGACALIASGVGAVATAVNPHLTLGQKALGISLDVVSGMTGVAAFRLADPVVIAADSGSLATADGVVGFSETITAPGLFTEAEAQLVSDEAALTASTIKLSQTAAVQQGAANLVQAITRSIGSGTNTLGLLVNSFTDLNTAIGSVVPIVGAMLGTYFGNSPNSEAETLACQALRSQARLTNEDHCQATIVTVSSIDPDYLVVSVGYYTPQGQPDSDNGGTLIDLHNDTVLAGPNSLLGSCQLGGWVPPPTVPPAVLSSLGLPTSCSSSNTTTTTAPQSTPYFLECSYGPPQNSPTVGGPPVMRPNQILGPCGVGFASENGFQLLGLGWTSWNSTGAAGAGTYTVNSCTPSCAAGSQLSYPVNLMLSTPKLVGGLNVFTTMTIQFSGAIPAAVNAPSDFGAVETDPSDYVLTLPNICAPAGGQTAGGC
jgi:hypothetical protein